MDLRYDGIESLPASCFDEFHRFGFYQPFQIIAGYVLGSFAALYGELRGGYFPSIKDYT